MFAHIGQVGYYTDYIKSRDDWEFVDVYMDEGISGTNTKRREGFKRMVADALGGKIDLIVTKSVSRFARNTVDSLTTIRQLKDKGVECYFENINTNTEEMPYLCGVQRVNERYLVFAWCLNLLNIVIRVWTKLHKQQGFSKHYSKC